MSKAIHHHRVPIPPKVPNVLDDRLLCRYSPSARRYAKVIAAPDVVMLDDRIGHWPKLKARDAVLKHFLAHVDRVTAG